MYAKHKRTPDSRPKQQMFKQMGMCKLAAQDNIMNGIRISWQRVKERGKRTGISGGTGGFAAEEERLGWNNSFLFEVERNGNRNKRAGRGGKGKQPRRDEIRHHTASASRKHAPDKSSVPAGSVDRDRGRPHLKGGERRVVKVRTLISGSAGRELPRLSLLVATRGTTSTAVATTATLSGLTIATRTSFPGATVTTRATFPGATRASASSATRELTLLLGREVEHVGDVLLGKLLGRMLLGFLFPLLAEGGLAGNLLDFFFLLWLYRQGEIRFSSFLLLVCVTYLSLLNLQEGFFLVFTLSGANPSRVELDTLTGSSRFRESELDCLGGLLLLEVIQSLKLNNKTSDINAHTFFVCFV